MSTTRRTSSKRATAIAITLVSFTTALATTGLSAAVARPSHAPNLGGPSASPAGQPMSWSLDGVDVLSPHDAWASGTLDIDENLDHTIAEHWNGSTWTRVPSPNPGFGGFSWFSDLDAVSSHDVWAVGGSGARDYSKSLTLVEHWDGTAWRVVQSPTPPTRYGAELTDVSAVAADDVWAVGTSSGAAHDETLVLHWDGTSWRRVSSPSPGVPTLTAVSAISASDVWAVGQTGYPLRTLIEHWDGKRWQRVPSPNPSTPGGAYLNDVASVGPDDVWAVGSYDTDPNGTTAAALVEHWNGKRWLRVAKPNPGGPEGLTALRSVSAARSDDVWAVGYDVTQPEQQNYRTVVEHWDGDHWTHIPNPHHPNTVDLLEAVSARSAGDARAVGSYTPDGALEARQLRQHWDGTRWLYH